MATPREYKIKDCFIDYQEENCDQEIPMQVLDSMMASPESKVLERLLSSNPTLGNRAMVTITMKPCFHKLSVTAQYELLREHIRDIIVGVLPDIAYYATFEKTRKGNIHAHMIIDFGFDWVRKRICFDLKSIGFIVVKQLGDPYGAYDYLMKSYSEEFPALMCG